LSRNQLEFSIAKMTKKKGKENIIHT
jgi:hypothetical protein